MVLKRQLAVALRYDRAKDSSPRVLAKGRGLIARKIIELAREHNVPIKEDSDLVRILERLELRQEIPQETYIAVAEILSFIYRMNTRQQADKTEKKKS